jgi:hypothetical protein
MRTFLIIMLAASLGVISSAVWAGGKGGGTQSGGNLTPQGGQPIYQTQKTNSSNPVTQNKVRGLADCPKQGCSAGGTGSITYGR